MTPLKPYLIRSIYEWILDNGLTPHLLINTEDNETILPEEYIEDGKIVLNIKPEAIQGLTLGNEEILFNARFSGKALHIVTPVKAVLAIYAKENGRGMIFDQDDPDEEMPPPSPPEKKPPSKPPHLRIVK